MTAAKRFPIPSPPQSTAGFSLVEMMVALTLGLNAGSYAATEAANASDIG